MTPKVLIILGSTRQNRQGETGTRWITAHANQRSDAVFEIADLKDWSLPFFEGEIPPAMVK